jgi:predicted thioredoxin/glutaredoxin
MGDRVEVNTGRRIVMVQSVSEDLDCVDEVERLLRGLMAPTAHEM